MQAQVIILGIRKGNSITTGYVVNNGRELFDTEGRDQRGNLLREQLYVKFAAAIAAGYGAFIIFACNLCVVMNLSELFSVLVCELIGRCVKRVVVVFVFVTVHAIA